MERDDTVALYGAATRARVRICTVELGDLVKNAG